MSRSRNERAFSILQLCELAARKADVDFKDVHDQDVHEMNESFARLASKIRFTRSAAAAAWRPEFEAVLRGAHSMRVEVLDFDKKEARRPSMRCMACNRVERNCRFAIDLAGRIDSNAWLESPAQMMEQFCIFSKQYEHAFAPDIEATAVASGKLPEFDRGSFILGETCFKKAKLCFLSQTLLLEECYTKGHLFKQPGYKTPPCAGTAVYSINPGACDDFVNKQDQIELSIADERRPAPEIDVDENFWFNVDSCRLALSGDGDAYDKLVRDRALHELAKMAKRDGESDCEEVGAGKDDAQTGPARHKGKRKKRMRVCESDSEQESDERSGISDKQNDSDQEDDAGSDISGVVFAPSGAREAAPSASGVAGMQRADGVLPARRAALRSLMALGLKLEKDSRHADAAVVTAAVLTIQDLLQRVGDLAHTVV